MEKEIELAYKVANRARELNLDPTNVCEIVLAKNLAERVVGLVATIYPKLNNKKIVELINNFEKTYGFLDWRVAFKLAKEIALEKVCRFDNFLQAIDAALRTAFAYLTLGVVSAPIDGIVNVELKKRLDGKDYLCVNYAGPIRNAGGTACAVSVLILDYLRKLFKIDAYDAQPEEIKRTYIELQDYHEKVTNLQYNPGEEEIELILKNLPIEIGGIATETIEVSNYKDLPRIPTNFLRAGFCLLLSAGLPLKAPKLLKQISNFEKEFDFSNWLWLKDLVDLQKKRSSKEDQSNSSWNYLEDMVAGRPVLAFPSHHAGFRLRYGRCRDSGYSAQAINPATGYLLKKFIAYGTQIKPEKPSKSATLVTCSTIEGPLVRLKNGDVVRINNINDAIRFEKEIEKILFLGDILISYGDFYNRAQNLSPAGYCEEWWIRELEIAVIKTFQTFDEEKISSLTNLPLNFIQRLFKWPITTSISAESALIFSKIFDVALHPKFTWFWKLLSLEELKKLIEIAKKAKIIKNNERIEKILLDKSVKTLLEKIGLEHRFFGDQIILSNDEAKIFYEIIINGDGTKLDFSKDDVCDVLEALSKFSGIKIRDSLGTCIGARMGRPEKAKLRELATSPNVLFPVAEAGGRMRSLNEAVKKGVVKSNFVLFHCSSCGTVIYPTCNFCGKRAKKMWYCCGKFTFNPDCKGHGAKLAKPYAEIEIDFYKIFHSALNQIKEKNFKLIKGVKGTSSKNHFAEHVAKGILRAKWDLTVNKDGTIRYDATQLPLTHFKPKEIGTSIEKLKELGYTKDIYGHDLKNEDQILELKIQDVILPSYEIEGAHKVLFNVGCFIDELLEKFYKIEPFYRLESEKDLIGHLVVVLAPHTSAGVAARIIGFSKCQALLAHPILHAATRRDCDGDEASVMLLLDALINFSKEYLSASRGSTMDAPLLLIPKIIPKEVDDMVFDLDIVKTYPLEFYEASLNSKLPWEVKIQQLKSRLDDPTDLGFTHDTDNINNSVLCSAYKILPTMEEKLKAQLELAELLECVEPAKIVEFVIEKHFLKDTRGNLRQFFYQEFRCSTCNTKYRRTPLNGKCLCGGKLILTVSEGNINKYLKLTSELAKKYQISSYLQQCIKILENRIQNVFGALEKQTALHSFN